MARILASLVSDTSVTLHFASIEATSMGKSRPGYQCPMCSYAAACPKKLVKHCLAEVEDNIQFICSRCRISKDSRHWTMLQNVEHKCQKHSKNFDILMLATPLVDLKTLLNLGPKISPSLVDQVIREIGWSEPVNPSTQPLTKKRRGHRGGP